MLIRAFHYRIKGSKMLKVSLLFVSLLSMGNLSAQGPFAPAADSAGSTAIHMDSTAIIGWVNNATIVRGPQNITKPSGPLADVGDAQSVYGKPDGNVVSLGDGGSVTIQLSAPISNHTSYDFAVFENGFYDVSYGGYFLELAFVEVSSDGINFYRFPNKSLTPTNQQINSFDAIDPTQIYGYAGKYRLQYGTPFDLSELDNEPGLDIQSITHIRIVDVIGTLNGSYASYDSDGRKVNDPYPTAFGSGGFDLDAVALIDSSFATSISKVIPNRVSVFPNPSSDFIHVSGNWNQAVATVKDMRGSIVMQQELMDNTLDISHLKNGFYFIEFQQNSEIHLSKFIKM